MLEYSDQGALWATNSTLHSVSIEEFLPLQLPFFPGIAKWTFKALELLAI